MTAPFTLTLPLVIREAQTADIPALDWYGLQTSYRRNRDATFARHQNGEIVFLVADLNGFPVASLWVELTEKRERNSGELRALGVIPHLQGLGLGTRLIAAGEQVLRERGFAIGELGVGKDNPRAQALYERLGYQLVGEGTDEYEYDRPDGTTGHAADPIYWLHKPLEAK